jgi:hypothetical protein
VADSTITNLNPLNGGDVQAELDVLAVADVSTSETKKITVADAAIAGINAAGEGSIDGSVIIDNSISGLKLEENSVTTRELAADACYTENYLNKSVTQEKLADGSVGTDQLIDGSVTADKLAPGSVTDAAIADRSLDGIKLKLDTVTAAELAPDSVGESELADNSVDTAAVIDGALTTAKYADLSVTNEKLANGIDGQKLSDGSVDTNQLADGAITSDKTAGDFNGSEFLPQPAGTVLAGPATGTDAKPSFRQLTAQDLPTLEANNLPIASTTQLGVIQVGDGLAATAGGVLSINNAVTPETATKITYNAQGLVTGSSSLTPDDIPELSFDQITSGEIGADQLAECAVTGPKICDYATCLMQEDNPGSGDFLGQFWYQPSTAQLRVYSRGSGPENIWLPVGFGALQANNLRWGGTYNADTDTIVTLTSAGTAAGLTAGSGFPAPADGLSGLYFVCETAGSNCTQPNLSGITHSEGDWALCVDQAQGWIHIKTGTGGGGGGAQRLNDLLDVEIGGPASPFGGAGGIEPAVALSRDQLLRYDGTSGLWRNTDILDGGSID